MEEISLKGDLPRTLILVHGLTGTPNEMKFLAYYFNKLGYSVHCPRLANHGEPLQKLKYTSWEEFYQSVREAFLEARKRGDKVFVAGLSMSALLVLLLANEFGDEVGGVACLAPTLFFDGWAIPWYRCFLPVICHTGLKNFVYFKEDAPYGIKNERIRDLVHKYFTKAKLKNIDEIDKFGYAFFPVTLLYQLELLVKHLTSKLKDIEVPVQLIHSKEDDTASLENSRFIFDRIGSKIKEMVILKNSYHVITADQERDKVAHKMESFFEKIHV
ncbi:MAG: alpha/beta fold hydrolase [Candidatus Omnitrophica bacterium]|nr:alpha/beta fold hydrolase [Candidatus Omnitrophota bacterium]